MGAAGPIREARRAGGVIAGQPFIGGRGTDPEPATERLQGGPQLLGEPNEFVALRHGRHLFPRHGAPPVVGVKPCRLKC